MSASSLKIPTIEAMTRARASLENVVRHTPLVPLTTSIASPNIWLKLETFQPVNSFKIRGVFHAVQSLAPERRARGLKTVSAGNTAQALAWAGRHFGVSAESLMPETAPASKIEAVETFGGTPRLVPVEELFDYLKHRDWENESTAFIHPWIEPNVMLGHASLGLELIEDLDSLNSVFVPVGGGGLIAGVASAVKSLAPHVRIFGVEPSSCCALHASLLAGAAVASPCSTICDGVAVPYLTEEMFPLLRQLVDEVILVADTDVRRSVRDLALGQKLVAEASGALALAAARLVPPEKRGVTACIVTGGSIDPQMLTEILSETT